MAQTYYAKSIFVSKTFWVNVALGLLWVADQRDFVDVLPAAVKAQMPTILVVANLVLRYFSTRPVAVIAPNDVKPVAVKSLSAFAALALAAGMLTGCASATSQASYERTIATHGATVADTLARVSESAAALNKQGVLPSAQALRVQEAIVTASERGKQLAAALRALDAVKGGEAAAEKQSVQALVNDIGQQALAIAGLLGDRPEVVQVRDLLRALLNATNAILVEIGGR